MDSKKEANIKKEVLDIYTPLNIAKKEIWRRWRDKELRKKVEDFLEGDVPEVFLRDPKAVEARYVLSPNFEFLRFLDLSKKAGIKPLCLEYLSDKFVAENVDKYHLCKLFFYDGNGKKGGGRISTLKIINFDKAEGKKICELKNIWGESIVNFHHKIMSSVDPKMESYDITSWYKKHGRIPKNYYSSFFALFICHGILFENYLLNRKEISFTKEIILPNFKKVSEFFGLKPLIVNLNTGGNDNNAYECYYPESIKNKINKLNRKT